MYASAREAFGRGRDHIDRNITAYHERRRRLTFIACYARQRTESALGDRHDCSVQARADKFPSLPLWGVGIAVMLLSTGGFGALLVWMPAPTGASRDILPVSSTEFAQPVAAMDPATLPAEGTARRKKRCDECGLIESILEMEGHGEAFPLTAAGRPASENQNRTSVRSASRNITVRLEDGSSRVIIDANPGRWRRGERVIVIVGLDEPKR